MNPATVVVISASSDFIKRVTRVAVEDGHEPLTYSAVEELFDDVTHNLARTEFQIIDATSAKIQTEIIGLVQAGRQFCPNSFIMVVVGGKTAPEVTAFVKKSGANAVLLENEFLVSSKLEYIWSQAVKSPYFPIKAASLKEGARFEYDLMHFMPMNRKFLKVVPKGTVLTDSKLEKMNEVGEFYVHKENIDDFISYSASVEDKSAAGLTQRCRLQFQKLNVSFSQLVLLLSDQSEYASFAEGKILFERCLKSTEDLLMNLSSVGDPWEVIDNAAFGGYGSVDRAASIAAYVGLLSLKSGVGSSSDCMIGALMSDIGMLDLNPSTTLKIRKNEMEKFNAEEKDEYEKHMIYSLNQCLSRRVPLSENLKAIILNSHVEAGGKGFPANVRVEKVPVESFMVHFCERFDKLTVVQAGRERPHLAELKKRIFEEYWARGDVFPLTFLTQIKNAFLSE